MVKCFTCGKFMSITDKKCHVGHLIKAFDTNSTNFSVALEFENIGINCYQCNVYSGGRQDIMKEKLTLIHGKDKIEKLYIKKHNYMNLDKFVMGYYSGLYKKLLGSMIERKGDPWAKKTAIRTY